MDKGGTKQPTKRKTSGFKIGDRIRCIAANSQWYSVGKEYEVVPHPKSQLPSVQASDGLYDEMVMIASKFELVGKDSTNGVNT